MSATAGRQIWVLGGTSAIALAYSRLAAAVGARLMLIGRNGNHLNANAADLTARGGQAAIEVLDLASKVDHDAVVGGLINRYGFPDEVLVATKGGTTGRFFWRALPDKFWHWTSGWKRFWRLSRPGTFEALFDALARII